MDSTLSAIIDTLKDIDNDIVSTLALLLFTQAENLRDYAVSR